MVHCKQDLLHCVCTTLSVSLQWVYCIHTSVCVCSKDVSLPLPEGVAEAQDELFVRMEAVEEEVRRLKERVDELESGLPYLNTRRSVLNTLMFMAWLLLPVGMVYLLTHRRK